MFIGVCGQVYESVVFGMLGGYWCVCIYGWFDCVVVCWVIVCGGYVWYCVFFLNEVDVCVVGYWLCVVCMLQVYVVWK